MEHSMSDQKHTTPVEWRTLPWATGYRFGSDGQVQSGLRRGKGRVFHVSDCWRTLTPDVGKKGYCRIKLCVGISIRWHLVHHLILEAFDRRRPEGMECRHKDGNPRNNHRHNLEWTTHRENEADKIRHGTLLMGSRHNAAKLSEPIVAEIRAIYAAGGWKQKDLAELYGTTQITVSNIVTRKTWKHVG
jgi:hypothetical protein